MSLFCLLRVLLFALGEYQLDLTYSFSGRNDEGPVDLGSRMITSSRPSFHLPTLPPNISTARHSKPVLASVPFGFVLVRVRVPVTANPGDKALTSKY
jgi:hypothetical protein